MKDLDFLKFVTNPFAMMGLIAFVAINAFVRVSRNRGKSAMSTNAEKYLFFLSLASLGAGIAVAFFDASKAPSVVANCGSAIAQNIAASRGGSVTLNVSGGNARDCAPGASSGTVPSPQPGNQEEKQPN